MSNIYVQFADSSESAIVSVFCNEQDPAVWPNQGVIPSSDARWATFYNAQPSTVKQYLMSPGV